MLSVSDNVTSLVSALTVAPELSSTFTEGCVPKSVPPVAVGLGWVVNSRCVPGGEGGAAGVIGEDEAMPTMFSREVDAAAWTARNECASPKAETAPLVATTQ